MRTPWFTRGFLGALLSFGAVMPSFAMDATETLPVSVNSPALRYGLITGVDSKYGPGGGVQSLNDTNTIHFDSKQLQKLDATLIPLFNQISSGQRLGDQLDLGTLRIESKPEIRYFVPIYARGITDTFTLAAALPVLRYRNQLRLVQSASNAAQVCGQIGGSGTPEVQDACNQISRIKMTDVVAGQLAARGYKPIQDRDESMVGDLQFVGLWRFFEKGPHSVLVRNTLTLPTGKKKDADDLAALGVFGETAIESQFIYNYQLTPTLRLAGKAGYRYAVPDRVDYRVPQSEGDILPDQSSKENVTRKLGDTITLGASASWTLWTDIGFGGGYEYVSKMADRYDGTRGARYDLIGRDSDSVAHRLRGEVSYDTIDLYRRKKNFPPLKVAFEVSNTVAGKNVDRQLVNELSLTLFF